MKSLENQQAIITLDKNILIIKTEKEKFKFVANQDNFIVIQNKGLLGGEVVCSNNKVVVLNQSATHFQSGQEYLIEVFEFYDDMLGETSIKFEKTYYSLYLELKSADNKFCDLQIDSDKIIFLSDTV